MANLQIMTAPLLGYRRQILLIVLLAGAICGVAFPLSLQSHREWHDTSGRFKVSAVYVGRTAGGVVLRRENGTEMTVPLERLSAADQEYVRKLTAPDTATPNEPPTVAAVAASKSDSFLFIETLHKGEFVNRAVGVVAFVDGDRAFIAVVDGRIGMPNHGPDESLTNVKYEAVVRTAGKERRVSLENLPLGELRPWNSIALSAPKDQLPPPIRLQSLPQVAVGQKFVFVGAANPLWDRSDKTFDRVETQVAKLLTSPTGAPTGFTVSNVGTGVLLNERDEIVSLARVDESPRVVRSPESIAIPTDWFRNAAELQLHSLRIRQTRPTPNEVKLEFLLQTRDPHTALHTKQIPRILLKHMPEERKKLPDHENLHAPGGFVIGEGHWTNIGDGTEVQLQPAVKWDEELDIPPATTGLNIAHWSGSYTYSTDKKLAPIYYQVVAVDAQSGKIIRLLDRDSHVKVPAALQLPLLFRHPVAQYDMGVPLLPWHPNGGRILTVDPPPTAGTLIERPLPKPQQVNLPLLVDARDTKSFGIARLKLSTAPGPQQASGQRGVDPFLEIERKRQRAIAPMVVSPDGKFLYVVDGREGSRYGPTLHKIDIATWTDTATLGLDNECRTIGLAAGGLVVRGRDAELWIVDPQTLEITKRLILGGRGGEIIARPNLPVAYILSSAGITSFDTVAGKLIQSVSHKRFDSVIPRIDIENFRDLVSTLALSPDGKYLFKADERLHRIRIEGTDMVYEAGGTRFGGPTPYRFSLSDDLSIAAVPAWGGDVQPEKLALVNPKTMQPSPVSLDVGPEITAVAFDLGAGRIFAAGKTKHVIQFDAAGKSVAEATLGPTEEIRRIIVVPNHGAAIYWGDVITVVDPDPKRLAGASKAN